MDSASTSLELIAETGWIADSDIRDLYLDSAAVTAPAQVIDVSVQGSVEAPPAIDVGQALTTDNVIPTPQCETLITCAHVLSLASSSNQLLLTSTRLVHLVQQRPCSLHCLASRQECKDQSACPQARLYSFLRCTSSAAIPEHPLQGLPV